MTEIVVKVHNHIVHKTIHLYDKRHIKDVLIVPAYGHYRLILESVYCYSTMMAMMTMMVLVYYKTDLILDS